VFGACCWYSRKSTRSAIAATLLAEFVLEQPEVSVFAYSGSQFLRRR